MIALEQLTTPAALVDVAQMQRNIDRTQSRMNELGVKFRPHVGDHALTERVRELPVFDPMGPLKVHAAV